MPVYQSVRQVKPVQIERERIQAAVGRKAGGDPAFKMLSRLVGIPAVFGSYDGCAFGFHGLTS